MSSSATAPSLTSATQRQQAKPEAVAAATTAKKAATTDGRYSHRQAKSFKKDELKQFRVPDLTVKDLLSSIPAHCFERSALKSSAYVVVDFTLVGLLGLAASYIDPTLSSFDFAKSSPLTPYLSASWQYSLARFALWSAYAFAQGLVFTGIWVIAHECGHQSYSASKTINNTVGWFLHSALLVPYHSWRISHARHHAATGHLTRDEVFVPRTRAQKGLLPLQPAGTQAAGGSSDESDDEQVDALVGGAANQSQQQQQQPTEETWGEWIAETLEDAPLYNFIYIIIQQLFGWPLYLIQNSSGQLHFPKGTNHFDPNSIIFDARHRSQVLISDVGIALTLSTLFAWGTLSSGGFAEVARYYIAPYLWCNHWLVMITYLQHTDPAIPHYTADSWTFPRGALCTVDRQWLGPVGPYLFHGISETHVLHHVSSKIPHYNAWEASEALKQRLGEHYQSSDENVFVSLWKSMRTCKFVDESDRICFYKDAHGVPRTAVAPDSGYNSDSGLAMSE
ncbi:hypothetical protein FA10DRAFT_266663 [Acaromyces ingoldii]|uniref:Fatty acid desaturase domain-containing protein n=1 Tax=Acaromyces ingoldii TaxID=215250 RepID=A0A316YKT8_9BASI|nr:hypothetical protein FA10DRAFT_266663 [Acaromyces ingoldii]PWN90170.1 hypothetical protein FA10DRAFT_266663 [Acaromyces ingoldii]